MVQGSCSYGFDVLALLKNAAYTWTVPATAAVPPRSGELFGVAPVPPGQAHIAVEQASDSSRNFVLRYAQRPVCPSRRKRGGEVAGAAQRAGA